MGLRPGQLFIAEAKPVSPFGYRSEHSWEELFEVADEYGDWVSVHTDKRWGGSFKLLAEARRRTNKTLLAKGLHQSDDDIERALDAGADFVLTVGRQPEPRADRCLIEPLTVYELNTLARGTRAVWNARNPLNGEDKIDGFEHARKVYPNGWLCQASNIRTIEDVQPSADAVLVGTHLLEFVRSLQLPS